MEAYTCKRDIAGAFSRLLLHPPMVKLITTEFAAEVAQLPEDIVAALLLTFWMGWRSGVPQFGRQRRR